MLFDYLKDESKYGLDRYNEIENKINSNGDNIESIVTKDDALAVLQRVGRRNWDVVI